MNIKLKPIKVYIVGGATNYASWFSFAHEILPCTDEALVKADLVFFTGGEDVTPSLYGDKKLPQTFCNYTRDMVEIEIFKTALALKIPMIGVCRGSQFLTVMQEEGKLVQHVTQHANGNHLIKFLDQETTYFITSTHHQMMYPFKVAKAEILAVANTPLSAKYELGDYTTAYLPGNIEPEIVYYPVTNCLCIQGHPEMMEKDMPIISVLNNLVLEKLKLIPYEEIP